MMDRCLTLNIEYDLKRDSYSSSGDLNENGKREVVETFLRGQMGKGKDETPHNERDKYHIQLRWFPDDDRIEATSDTGNKSLRDGLLVGFLKT